MLDYRIMTFLTLYKEMNYRRTAEILSMTQPGVTQHIKYLEKTYGVKLFEYDGRRLKKTAAADILRRHLTSVHQEEQRLFEKLQSPELVSLRIGATKTIGEFVIPQKICNFLKADNHVIRLRVDNTTELLSAVDRGEIDFAIIEGGFDKSKYRYKLYSKEEFVGVCSKKHKFADKSVDFADVFEERLILRERGSGTRAILEKLLSDYGYCAGRFKRLSSMSSFSLIKEVVANSLGITFAYKPIVLSDKRLASFHIGNIKLNNEFNYVYSNRSVAKEKIDLFIALTK